MFCGEFFNLLEKRRTLKKIKEKKKKTVLVETPMIAILMQHFNVATGEKSIINTYSTLNTVDIRRKKNINIQKGKDELAREILNYTEIQT